MEEKTYIIHDIRNNKWIVYHDGSVVHRAGSRDLAEKTLAKLKNITKAHEDAIVKEVVTASTEPVFNTDKSTLKYDIKAHGSNVAELIPVKDKNYVPFGNYDDVHQIIESALFYPSYISGPSGNGKSMMVEQICARLNKPMIRINLNMMVDEEVLIGSKTLINGNVDVVEGPVLIAMRTGATLLLDEVDAGAANTLLCLQPILEGKPYYFKLKNEIITPALGFNVMATANTKGKGSDDGRYIGTNVLNEAFLERFAVTFNQEYPPQNIEKNIIKRLMTSYGIEDEEFSTTLSKWASSIRKTYSDGAIDETISTRRITHIIRAYAVFKDRKKAVELCCNRFDTETKNAFINMFDKLLPVPVTKPASTVKKVSPLVEQEF